MLAATWRIVEDIIMGRKTWTRCACGKKLHVKKKVTVCYECSNKARKEAKKT